MKRHSYEEIREVVLDVLLKKESVSLPVTQYLSLTKGVAEVVWRRERLPGQELQNTPPLIETDEEFVRDVFWDLFRQGFITLGSNNSNPMWPHFRLSPFGQTALEQQSPWRFHSVGSFVDLVRQECPDIGDQTITYLGESVAAFYADCMLASCVMLGVAAESEFLRLIETAVSSQSHPKQFSSLSKDKFIRAKIVEFQSLLAPISRTLTPRNQFEDLDINLSLIQSVLRIARNEAGHPSGAPAPNREQVYVFLQMFVPFARQLMWLRKTLA
jgi:hypothetical protein